jgi:hypothetical protein
MAEEFDWRSGGRLDRRELGGLDLPGVRRPGRAPGLPDRVKPIENDEGQRHVIGGTVARPGRTGAVPGRVCRS